jgi:chemotaxis protein CheX
MPGTLAITEHEVRTNIVRAVADVFKTMLNRRVMLLPDNAPPAPVRYPPVRQIVGTVGIAGDANGVVYLRFHEPFARRCTGDMLRLTDKEVSEMGDETVSDAVAELTNMIAGSFKNWLCDSGLSCRLSIPATVSGTDFTICPWHDGADSHYIYRFESSGQSVVVDVIVRIGG